MTNLLRELAMNSIKDYYHIFCPRADQKIPGKFPGFVVNAVLNGTSLEFEPNSQGFEIVVLTTFDKLVEAACSVPHVETKLYPNESAHTSKPNLKPVIEASILDTAKADVSGSSKHLHSLCLISICDTVGEPSIEGGYESTS